MNKLLTAFAAVVLLLSSQAYAADADAPKREPTAAQKAQREKMKTCNQEAKAKELKGDERKEFMRGCLSQSGKANTVASKEKAEQCKQEAQEQKLRGDERKAYLAACLGA